MYRAQGIKKRWQALKRNDSTTSPLMDFIQYQYDRYLTLCNRCSEKPLTIGKWLTQKIVGAN